MFVWLPRPALDLILSDTPSIIFLCCYGKLWKDRTSCFKTVCLQQRDVEMCFLVAFYSQTHLNRQRLLSLWVFYSKPDSTLLFYLLYPASHLFLQSLCAVFQLFTSSASWREGRELMCFYENSMSTVEAVLLAGREWEGWSSKSCICWNHSSRVFF